MTQNSNQTCKEWQVLASILWCNFKEALVEKHFARHMPPHQAVNVESEISQLRLQSLKCYELQC